MWSVEVQWAGTCAVRCVRWAEPVPESVLSVAPRSDKSRGRQPQAGALWFRRHACVVRCALCVAELAVTSGLLDAPARAGAQSAIRRMAIIVCSRGQRGRQCGDLPILQRRRDG